MGHVDDMAAREGDFPSMTIFSERLAAIRQQKKTNLALMLAPRVPLMPVPIAKYDDPFLPFGKAIIDVTHDLVCAYLFDLASYLSIGAAGAVALERTIAYAKGESVLTILHGVFSTEDYVEAAGAGGFGVDAVTVCGSDEGLLKAYNGALHEGVIVAEQGDRTSPAVAARLSADNTRIEVINHHLPGGVVSIRVARNEVLYASQREDFAEQVRAALEAMR